jgi:hypothetical protein
LLGYCENIKGNCRDLEKKVNNLLSTIFDLEGIKGKLVESVNQIQNMVLVAKKREYESTRNHIFAK